MNPLKQFGLLFLLIVFILSIFFSLYSITANDFEAPENGIIVLSITIILLGFFLRYLIRDELEIRKTHFTGNGGGKLILEFKYEQQYWADFARILYKEERNKYFKGFSIVTFFVVLFLIFMYKDLQMFTIFSVMILLVWLPVLIYKLDKFKNNKKVYLNEINPNIRLTTKGVLINSKIFHSFTYLNTEMYEVRLEEYGTKQCISITTFHRSPNRGGSFKTSYIPIPSNVHKNKVDYYYKKAKKELL